MKALDKRVDTQPKPDGNSNVNVTRKPGLGTFLCSWFFPLFLLLVYKSFIEGALLDFAMVASYTFILAIAAGVGLIISRIKHRPSVSDTK